MRTSTGYPVAHTESLFMRGCTAVQACTARARPEVSFGGASAGSRRISCITTRRYGTTVQYLPYWPRCEPSQVQLYVWLQASRGLLAVLPLLRTT